MCPGGAGGVGEDRGPLVEREVRGEDDALAVVPSAHDPGQEVGPSFAVGEVNVLVDRQQTGARVGGLQTSIEAPRMGLRA